MEMNSEARFCVDISNRRMPIGRIRRTNGPIVFRRRISSHADPGTRQKPVGCSARTALTTGSASFVKLGGRIFAIALGLSFPVLVPLFVLSIAQGRNRSALAPQVNILVAAPAAILMAGLVLLGLDSAGLGARIMRAWTSVMTQSMEWLNG